MTSEINKNVLRAMDDESRGGSNKITPLLSTLLMPKATEIHSCQLLVTGEGVNRVVCKMMDQLSLSSLPKHEAVNKPTKNIVDQGRQITNLIQRVCPVSNHLPEKMRSKLPCFEVRRQLEEFLRKT
jgi:hypothetical protein